MADVSIRAASVSAPAVQKPLHIAFEAIVSGDLRREAEARGVTPHALVVGAVKRLLDEGLWDAVFDGDSPLLLAGGRARHRGTDLTLLQAGVLYLLSIHTSKDGACHFSTFTLAEQLAGTTMRSVQGALAVLERRGLIRRDQKRFAGGVQPWRLTSDGQEAAGQLAGIDFTGGQA